MKRWLTYTALAVALTVFALAALRLHPYYRLAKEQPLACPSAPVHQDDTLRVAIVGDSWAAYHHGHDRQLQALLTAGGRPVLVASRGNVGAKSREVYERLLTTSRPLLADGPDYAVVMAGINDAVAKLGPDFYVHHYMLMLRLLLQAGIRPVVVEMPDVDYRAVAGRERWTRRLHHRLSAVMAGAGQYGFKTYREALWRALSRQGLADSVVVVAADEWNKYGWRDMRGYYRPDGVHLNEKGYCAMDTCLAEAIGRDLARVKRNKTEE